MIIIITMKSDVHATQGILPYFPIRHFAVWGSRVLCMASVSTVPPTQQWHVIQQTGLIEKSFSSRSNALHHSRNL